MKTQLLLPTAEALNTAATLLQEGKQVAFPTETVYGLGANALNETAVRGIFEAKGRPADNPLIVHVPTADAAEPLCYLTQEARQLMHIFCPGPLTLLLPKKEGLPPVVNAGLPSIAIRIPGHPVAQALLHACRLPIAAPSANTSGRPSPTLATHVLEDLHGKIPLVLDGGPCELGVESTVLDLTAPLPTILRPGSITQEMLLTVLPQVQVAESVLRPLREGEKALSPGMLYRHYAPKGRLWLVKGAPKAVRDCCLQKYQEALAEKKSSRILVFQEHVSLYPSGTALSIGSYSRPETVAHALFAMLRQMDAEQVDVLLCEVLPPDGIGLAIMNRLSRAASFQVIDADKP